MDQNNNMEDRRDYETLINSTLQSEARKGQRGVSEFTHNSVDVIVQKLRLGSVERFLLWLSKTDLYAMSVCTYHTRLTLNGLGLMVLFTSILAMLSSIISLSTVIDDKIEMKGLIVIICACIYAFGIMIIDREIVGAQDRRALLIRLVFAVMIAIVVSYPIKLKLLDGPIKAEIKQMVEERNIDKKQRIEKIKATAKGNINKEVEQLSKTIASERETIADLEKQIHKEQTDQRLGAICDKRCEKRKAEQNVAKERMEKYQNNLAILNTKDGLNESNKAEINLLQEAINEDEGKLPTDFLSYWQASDRVMKKDKSSARVLSYFLFGFFLALELVPLGLKLALGTTEYQQYLEARHRLNLQKVAQVTNIMLEEIQNTNSLTELLEMHPELSDFLAYFMEDSLLPTDATAVIQKLSANNAKRQAAGPPKMNTASQPGPDNSTIQPT